MDNSISSRLKHVWNAFRNKDQTEEGYYKSYSYGTTIRPDRPRFSRGNDRTIVTSVYNRIAIDASSINVKHVRLDDNDRFISDIESGLNQCLTVESNLDQTSRSFMQDVIMSMLDEGCVAIIPVDTSFDPTKSTSYDIHSMRTAEILYWHPQDVTVRVYNEKTGLKEELRLPKRAVAIIENPLYAVMNEPNSTMQRLIHKLSLLDLIDENNSSGKLDLIIQLPYAVKTESRRAQADIRRTDIETQLRGSKYGIAYIDSTEHITQLNRAVENNLMSQIEYLTNMLYSQIGITQGILDGTADEKTMLNYYNRTIEPIISAVVDEMKRKFITKTARTQKQSINFFRDPFKLVPVSELSDIADKFTRNEILSSNEIRQIIGRPPSEDPNADQLRNKNLNQASGQNEGEAPQPNMENPQAMSNDQAIEIFESLLNSLETNIDNVIDGKEIQPMSTSDESNNLLSKLLSMLETNLTGDIGGESDDE